jgi:transposase
MKAYPVEFRHRVVELHRQGWTTEEIRQALGVSRAWVDSIKRLHAARKPLDIKSSANRRTSLAQRQGTRLKARVAEHPGTTLAELKRDLGLTESIWAIWKALRALGLSLKKSRSGPASGIARTSSGNGPSGRSSARGSTRPASSSSTRRSAPRR